MDNPYTQLDPAKLETLNQKLQSTLADRKSEFDNELTRQLENDKLCKQYAEIVDGIVKDINSSMTTLTQPKVCARVCFFVSLKGIENARMYACVCVCLKTIYANFSKFHQGELTEQLALVDKLISTNAKNTQTATQVKTMEAENTKRGISFNPHCTVTANMLSVQLKDYSDILSYKKPLLEQEIEYKKLRGVSPAQIQEIETFFKQFDKDNSGFIDKKEMKTCLYSLGEELPRARIEELVNAFGTGGRLDLAQFKNLMIHLLGKGLVYVCVCVCMCMCMCVCVCVF